MFSAGNRLPRLKVEFGLTLLENVGFWILFKT